MMIKCTLHKQSIEFIGPKHSLGTRFIRAINVNNSVQFLLFIVLSHSKYLCVFKYCVIKFPPTYTSSRYTAVFFPVMVRIIVD